jgi:phosphoketolase
MAIRCDKDGSVPGIASTKSSTKGMVAGNILFGGLIGAGVDVATGAAFDYPSLITVELGKTAAPAGDAEQVAQQKRAACVRAGTMGAPAC